LLLPSLSALAIANVKYAARIVRSSGISDAQMRPQCGSGNGLVAEAASELEVRSRREPEAARTYRS